MSEILDDLKYTQDHEWARIEGDIATIGITDHAQSELGDIVFVSLPEIGDSVSQSDNVGTIEAVKTVAEIYSPLSGEVIEVNSSLEENAAIINEDPYQQGWILKIRLSDVNEAAELMSAADYQNHIG